MTMENGTVIAAMVRLPAITVIGGVALAVLSNHLTKTKLKSHAETWRKQKIRNTISHFFLPSLDWPVRTRSMNHIVPLMLPMQKHSTRSYTVSWHHFRM